MIARLTGAAYLGMLPGGIVGFLVIRPRLIDANSAAGTLANIIQHEALARIGLVAALVVILAQALAALGFYALFRERQPVAAFGIAGFGLVNSAAILTGTAASWTALQLAEEASAMNAAPADIVHTLYQFEGAAWQIGGVFFGLWLIPMGWSVLRSGYFHLGNVLGWILIVGGAGYVVSSFVAVLPAAVDSGLVTILTVPATIGELWTMSALLIVGVRVHKE
ncbi:MAG: DUF4386 domain-containing protein [Deinococcales bacterium]